MDAPSHRPMFTSHSSAVDQSLPPLSVLANDVNRRGSFSAGMIDTRDSGNWSQSQSKHSSTLSSCQGVPIQSILNSDGPQVGQAPLPPLSRPYTHSIPGEDDSYMSQRSSIDSRVNYGFNHLAINPPSPTGTSHMTHPNSSRASLASSLAHQRGIPEGYPPPLPPAQSSMFPHDDQVPPPTRHIPRQAPVINPNPRSVSGMPDPTAAAPTKGYAWAFPDRESPKERRPSSSGDSSDRDTPSQLQMSLGCRPKDQGPGTYSRTPELRVSHKMAERKRRSEMKQLFEELHSILPHGPNTKSSKWEILVKAIEHIKSLRYSDQQLRRANDQLRHDSARLHQLEDENMRLRHEIQAARQQMGAAAGGRSTSYSSLSTTLGHEGGGPGSIGPSGSIGSTHTLPPPHPSHHAGPTSWGRPISSTSSAHSMPQPVEGPQSPSAMTGIEFGSQSMGYGR